MTKVEAQEPYRSGARRSSSARRRVGAPTTSQARAAAVPGDAQPPVHLSPIRVDPDRPARPLTRAEAASALGRHARTLDRWTRLGLLRTIEIAGTVRIPADEAERLLRASVARSEP